MSARPEDLDGLILDIHAAPLDETRWPGVVDALRRMVGADQAILFSIPQTRAADIWHVGSQTDPELTREYAVEFAPEDPWGLAAKRLPGPIAGRVLTGEELIHRSDFRRTRFFNEFLHRYDIDRFMCAVLRDPPFQGANVGASLSLYRGCESPAFGTEEREILSRLAPHLVLALKTLWEVRALSLHTGALKQTLDAVTPALFIIDRLGRILFANRNGQSVLSAGECLGIVDGRLGPSPKVREQKVCRHAFEQLRLGRATTVNLTVVSSGRKLILCTAPLCESKDSIAPWGTAAGLAWLVPMAATVTPVRRMATLFTLTPAEERLLGLLGSGHSLGEVSQSLHVSIHTVRSQLKSIQRKTALRSQSELVRMVQQLSSVDPPVPEA